MTYIAPFAPPHTSGINVGREYTGGLSDEELHRLAVEAGQAGIHAPDWGKNATEYYIEKALPHWHEVNAGLSAHGYREQVQALAEVLEPLGEQTDKTEQDALDAVDLHNDVALKRERLSLRMAREGLETPLDGRDWGLLAKLGGLFAADMGLLSVAYQVLGLSDKQFLGIPYLSENALTASGAVLGVVVLAHLAGTYIKNGLHHVALAPQTNNPATQIKEQ